MVLFAKQSDSGASTAGLPFAFGILAALACVFALLLTSTAEAAPPPLISQTSFSAVTETGATLQASVDPTGGKTNAHFEYTTLAEYEAHAFAGSQTAPAAPAEGILVPSSVKGKGNLTASSSVIIGVATTAGGAFGVGQVITSGTDIPAETTITAVEAEPGTETLKLKISKAATATVSPANLTATGPQPIGAALAGLSPATGYVFRAVAKKAAGAEEEAQGPPTTFYTFGPPPTFGSCANDALRRGQFAPPGAPGALLPDCRAFELASPLAKNGNDALSSKYGPTRASVDGGAVVFGSTFGIPGGVGAQSLPFYQAARGEGESGWTTTGLLPPAGTGSEAHFIVGQLPDLSSTYAEASRPRINLHALFELHRDGSPPIQLTPYTESRFEHFGFGGASADASTLLIEAPNALPQEEGGPLIPGGVPDQPNLYAWDRASGQLHLAGTMNTPAETQAKLAKGAYAGPYSWVFGRNYLSEGGAAGGNYVTDEHAVAADGSIFFTSASNGHLYERVNPTATQSDLDPQGNCTQPAKACTLDVSASRRTVPDPGPDPGGEQPAVFQAATPDGSQAFFTSSEKLTDDANTGPEQPPAQIGRATLNGEEPANPVDEESLSTHALGTAVDPKGEYIYWADPSRGTIGRAKLGVNGPELPAEPNFIEPDEGECRQEVKPPVVEGKVVTAPAVFEDLPIPDAPRYVAVDEGHVYWTNTGRRDDGGPLDGGGTIGRATLADGVVEKVEPAFICGEGPPPADPAKTAERLVSNPQGIAVNATHIYWANAAQDQLLRRIARAAIGGGEVEGNFIKPFGQFRPYGVALSATSLYLDVNEELNNSSYLERVPLEGGGVPQFVNLGDKGLRGLAVDSGHVYWATRAEGGSIGRLALGEFGKFSSCEAAETACQKHFLTPKGSLEGLASDGSHLYWSVNGEAPGNPGTDLYRYRPGAAQPLTDVVPDSTDPNGAEVRGVLGTSTDGSSIYFAANADLDGPGEAEPGDCKGDEFGLDSGQCNIYLSHDGQIDFVARVTTTNGIDSASINWLPKPYEVYSSSTYTPKSSLVSADGRSLAFRSDGQLYRYRLGQGVTCVSCNPSGGVSDPAGYFPSLDFSSIVPNNNGTGAAQVRFASSDGNRVFFETPAALVAYDTDASSGCPLVGGTYQAPSCLDVYEWEAPGAGAGTCTAGGPAYSPLNEGCLYLISQGTDSGPAFFADASFSGDDVFFFTRAQLVGEDSDELMDVYDARVEGGLVSQNLPPTPPCEAEGCKPQPTEPPAFQIPPQFSGSANPKPKRCHGKRCHHQKKQHKKRRHKQDRQRQADHRLGGVK